MCVFNFIVRLWLFLHYLFLNHDDRWRFRRLLPEGVEHDEDENPCRPGQLLKSELNELGLTITEAAKALGISRRRLHSVVAARAGVTADMAIRLEKAIGSTADTWLRMQMNYDLAQARKRQAALKVKRPVPA